MPTFSEWVDGRWKQRQIPSQGGIDPTPSSPAPALYVGLDLGQAQDYSALSIAERHGKHGADPQYHVRDLRRWPLNTSYPTIVADVIRLLATPPLADVCTLVIDQTGVGRAIGDLIEHQRPRCRAFYFVTITAGDTVTSEGRSFHVPKRDLVSAVQVTLQAQRLRVARALPEAATLVSELQSFQYKISPAGYDSYGAWREGQHDDLLLSVAMSVWAAEYGLPREVKFI